MTLDALEREGGKERSFQNGDSEEQSWSLSTVRYRLPYQESNAVWLALKVANTVTVGHFFRVFLPQESYLKV